MLILGLLGLARYVLWCYSGICQEDFTFIQIGSGHTVTRLNDFFFFFCSPGFKKNFAGLQKKRTQRHPYERVATPYQIYAWMSPQMEHTIDAIRAEDAFSSKLGYEEHIPGQTRDWNEELQTTRELSR